VKRLKAPLTIDSIRAAYRERRDEIRQRLAEFQAVGEKGSDEQFWEEMVYCFFTGGCSARMGINSVNAVRPLLLTGDEEQLAAALSGVHRYPNARAAYVVHSRNFLQENCDLRIRVKLESFTDRDERRDWLVNEKGIKGLGYKEASHFLRNIGYRGYAILDKHVLNSLLELGFIDEAKPPNSKLRYLRVEERFKDLTKQTGINFDELDLVLWSMKTGVILK
jgi:N-glycosylase/DNA lyase